VTGYGIDTDDTVVEAVDDLIADRIVDICRSVEQTGLRLRVRRCVATVHS
jgi:hypothetical protein